MKRILSFTLAVTILLLLVVPVSAATKDEVELMYTYINSVYACLTIDETLGIATCTGSVNAKNITPVKVIVRLQRYENGIWQTVKSWVETGTAAVSNTNRYAIYRGYSYRVYVTGYVYNSYGVVQEAASVYHYANLY